MIHYKPREVFAAITQSENTTYLLPNFPLDRKTDKLIRNQIEEIGGEWIGKREFKHKETHLNNLVDMLIDSQDLIRSIFREATTDENGILHLPNYQLDKKTYAEVKKQIEAIGGKWKGGKTQGFIFHEKIDADKVRDMLIKGIDLAERKVKYQFFGTPFKVATYILGFLPLRYNEDRTKTYRIKDTDRILEPSAGQGSIINAIHYFNPNVIVDCFEMMEENREILKTLPNVNILGDNFLESDTGLQYDIIVANPPFTNNQDIDHVARMLEHLKIGGTLISIMSPHWIFANDLKSRAFRYMINNTTSDAHYLPKGAFKDSGTDTQTTFVVLNKESLYDYAFDKIMEYVQVEKVNERLTFEKEMELELKHPQSFDFHVYEEKTEKEISDFDLACAAL